MIEKVIYSVEEITGIQRDHRVEIRTGAGQVQFFQLKACTRIEAIEEAEIIASTIAAASKKSVLYRLPNGDWTMAGANSIKKTKNKATIGQMIRNFFFVEDED